MPYEPNVEEEEETPVYIVAQGSCGSNVSWMIMSDGRLVIYGKGNMQFMMRSGAAPWSAYADLITTVEVTSGVESIADSAFADCGNITTVTVADTVKSIGNEAFAGCENLETVTFAGDAPEIGENCFEDISFNVQYPENNTTWTEEVQESFGDDIVWVPEGCAASGEHSLTTPTIENMVKATCTENGSYEEVKRCSECGKEFRDTIIVDATGHTYDQEKAEEKYLASEATCTEKASYFKSCACGEAGAETFKYGDLKAHVFDQEKVDPKYLVSDGVYYKSCVCGVTGTETFTVKEDKPQEKPEEKPEDKPVINFKDVTTDAFYYDAVMWAVGKGVTTGTGADTFSPDEVCNRGQVVTFLWRAAGKPEPTKTENPFTDVKTTDFFYKAVLWAAENGITTGTSATTFAPNETCNRGQVVTFLSRALKGSPKNSINPFTDVAAGAFYYNPVLWAVENGITNGTGADTFSPNADCNRGQVITFLYRAYK